MRFCHTNRCYDAFLPYAYSRTIAFNAGFQEYSSRASVAPPRAPMSQPLLPLPDWPDAPEQCSVEWFKAQLGQLETDDSHYKRTDVSVSTVLPVPATPPQAPRLQSGVAHATPQAAVTATNDTADATDTNDATLTATLSQPANLAPTPKAHRLQDLHDTDTKADFDSESEEEEAVGGETPSPLSSPGSAHSPSLANQSDQSDQSESSRDSPLSAELPAQYWQLCLFPTGEEEKNAGGGTASPPSSPDSPPSSPDLSHPGCLDGPPLSPEMAERELDAISHFSHFSSTAPAPTRNSYRIMPLDGVWQEAPKDCEGPSWRGAVARRAFLKKKAAAAGPAI